MKNKDAQSRPKIPVNVIAGSLGVGKTTAINHLLRQRPAHEKWAVLVNEYGQIGLDQALLTNTDPSKGVEIREVAGGCICCSAGFLFEVSLTLLLQRRPDRLLIEPTGLATLSGILDTLARKGIREAVDVRSIVSLVDPVSWDPDQMTTENQDQVEAADVLLASRSDLASPAHLDAFDRWAGGLFPPKRLVGHIRKGRIDLATLDLVTARAHHTPLATEPADGLMDESVHTPAQHRHHHHSEQTKDTGHAHHGHGHSEEAHDHADPTDFETSPSRPVVRRDHDSGLASTIGWAIWSERTFDAQRLQRWLEETTAHPGLRRLKAVLHTDEGWRAYNIADGAEQTGPSAYRRDSRLELIWMGPSRPTPDDIEQGFLSCLLP